MTEAWAGHHRPRPAADGRRPRLIASRLGRRISEPLLEVAERRAPAARGRPVGAGRGRRHRGDRGAGAGPQRPGRADQRAAGRRARRGRRPAPPAAHAGHRAAAGRRGGRRPRARAPGCGEHIGVLQRSIDAIVHEARRPVRDATCARPATPPRWSRERVGVLAGPGRGPGPRRRRSTSPTAAAGAAGGRRPGRRGRRPGRQRLRAHARAGRLRRPARPLDGDRVRLVVTDAGTRARRRDAGERDGQHRARPRHRPAYGRRGRRLADLRARRRRRDARSR